VSNENVFTTQELKELGQPRQELIQASIDAGEAEKAKKLTRQMHREFLSMHDIYRDWIASLLSFIGRHYGDDAVREALQEYFDILMQPLGLLYSDQSPRRRAQMAAAGLRGHLHAFKVEEDEEKFTFVLHPCGSGGRLALEGKYDPPCNFFKIKEAQQMTFQQQDFPVYCSHCYFQNIEPIKIIGKPLAIVVPPQNIGKEPCHAYLYKDPSYCPNEFKTIQNSGILK